MKKILTEYPDWLINIVIEDNKPITRRDSVDYIELYMLTEGGQLELAELCRRFGISDEKIRDAGMVWSV
jgi:hypothetical protein